MTTKTTQWSRVQVAQAVNQTPKKRLLAEKRNLLDSGAV
jgi:hypothetical protein